MKCTICGKPVVLVPSAAERARRFGGKPADYTRLFPRHAECELAKRAAPEPAAPARREYRVAWSIDLDAASPEEAARLALAIMRNPDSSATVFDVEPRDKSTPAESIDLDARDQGLSDSPEV